MKQGILLFLIFSLALIKAADEFEYNEGGEDWTGTCATGKEQSPINIHPSSAVCDDSLLLDLYVAGGVQTIHIKDKGDTLKSEDATFAKEYATNVEGLLTGYNSAQFHFHAPSEHRVSGRTLDLEMHFVHSMNQDFVDRDLNPRVLSVVGILFEVDDNAPENEWIAALKLDQIPDENDATGLAVTVDLKEKLFDTLPEPLTFFTYEGSLTTPPCTESVNWYVVDTPQKITSAQLKAVSDRYAGNKDFAGGKGNNRKEQALNGRIVKRGGSVCEFKTSKHILSGGAVSGMVIGSVFFGAGVVLFGVLLLKLIASKKSGPKHMPIPQSPSDTQPKQTIAESAQTPA